MTDKSIAPRPLPPGMEPIPKSAFLWHDSYEVIRSLRKKYPLRRGEVGILVEAIDQADGYIRELETEVAGLRTAHAISEGRNQKAMTWQVGPAAFVPVKELIPKLMERAAVSEKKAKDMEGELAYRRSYDTGDFTSVGKVIQAAQKSVGMLEERVKRAEAALVAEKAFSLKLLDLVREVGGYAARKDLYAKDASASHILELIEQAGFKGVVVRG